MQMAPNSNFNYPIQLEGQPLEAGEYRATITAESKGKHGLGRKTLLLKPIRQRNIINQMYLLKRITHGTMCSEEYY
ncbi:DUF3324 domain-containing protein [Bacillus paranthracis]